MLIAAAFLLGIVLGAVAASITVARFYDARCSELGIDLDRGLGDPTRDKIRNRITGR